MPLSDRAIKTAKTPKKTTRLWDGGGLYLELSTSGAKLWRFKYRVAGREKRLAFGAYPEVSLKAARERRDSARRVLANKADPGAVARAEKAARDGADTIEAIAREWHTKQAATWVKEYADDVLGRLVLNVFPYVGRRAPDDVAAQEWLPLLRRIEGRGALVAAKRVRAICSQVYRYAIATGRATRDPMADLRGALTPSPERHFPAPTEPEALRPILRVIDGYDGTLIVRIALKLQALLFVRPGELRSMRWGDIDDEKAQWRFTASKTETPHIVPLAKQARMLLDELRPLTGGGLYVFPSARSASRCMSDNTLNAALRRMGVDTKNEITGHGFRAAARTILEERLGFRPEVIELQLAHTIKDPLGRAYNRTTHLVERTRMMQEWADFLDVLRTENVVAVDSRRATGGPQ